jgi:sterol desaturase/sphingolipid hydroxylase (fatty acid hydroxylase superfamily)
VKRARLVRLWPYAAAFGVVAVVLAMFLILEPQTVSGLWSGALGFAEVKWQRAFGPTGIFLIGIALLLVMELFFLTWEKTTIFIVFVRRSASAIADIASMIFFFWVSLKTVAESFFTFGVAFAIAKLVDWAAAHFDWVRWQLPSEGIVGISASFAVFYLFTTFIGYWQHRMMHWRWFWHLHRFHHAATEINILTSFRSSPGEALRVLPFAIPLFFVKPPSAEMFAAFTVANQLLSLLQHSELPWSLGWLGRWLIVSPQYHQIHHSMDEEHRDLNFSVCPIWDHLFGTWYAGSRVPSAYGIPDQAHIERPYTQWLIDIWIFYRDAARSLAGVARSVLARVRPRRPSLEDGLGATTSIPAE